MVATSRVDIRLAPQDAELIRKAAGSQGRSVSNFFRHHTLAMALDVLGLNEDEEQILIRASAQEVQLLRQAAAAYGVSLSKFMLGLALKVAKDYLDSEPTTSSGNQEVVGTSPAPQPLQKVSEKLPRSPALGRNVGPPAQAHATRSTTSTRTAISSTSECGRTVHPDAGSTATG